jgi:iron complex transport system substrate-binding protein
MPPSFKTRTLGRWTRLVSLAAAALLALAPRGGVCAQASARPQRIVSLNACADQYLIALADKDQVAALTRFARDPTLSYYAQRAKAYPISQDEAEAVLALHPDLVIASPYHRVNALTPLKGYVRVLDLEPAESFDDVVRDTRIIATAIGQTARGEALIASMRARVAAAGRRPLNGVAAEYERGGYITGPGTLMDDLMTRAGLINLARRGHGAQLGQMSLEQIVYARPDFLILTDGGHVGQDEGDLSLDHPALVRAVPPARRLHVPAAMTVCGGPSYPEALERLQAQADRARTAGH